MINPYADDGGEWVRGNFHGHTAEGSGCASVPLRHGVSQYYEGGARFMAITDHDRITEVDGLAEEYAGMLFLRGFEHSEEKHLLFIGENVPPLYELPLPAAMMQAQDLLTIVCHPEPVRGQSYWDEERIQELKRLPDGIEVYNGHYGTPRLRERGRQPNYTHIWDALLSKGYRIWGFANDDFHDPEDFDNAFNMVRVEEITASQIIMAAKRGACYGSTGLLAERIDVQPSGMSVTIAENGDGRFIGPGGRVLLEASGREFTYRFAGEQYVRFEARSHTGELFLQPVFP